MRILLLHEWAYQSTKHLAGPHMLIGLCSFTDESKMTDGFYSFQLAYKVYKAYSLLIPDPILFKMWLKKDSSCPLRFITIITETMKGSIHHCLHKQVQHMCI